jgi:predicted dehydrogenase
MVRRVFLTSAALSAASYQRVLGANNRVRLGLIGCGGRGRYVARFMAEAPDTEFVATADVFLPNAESARQWAGASARAFQDFRQLLELNDVDAVLIATPDHWHAIPTVLACQAGKDVYVEKPLAHNIYEGRKMVEAARRYRRIVVTGTQQRSATHFSEVANIIQSGQLGDVRFVRIWNFVNMSPNGVTPEPDSAPPDGLDWDFYLGPAPKVPYNRRRHLSTYRWFSDYSGGYITDYGTHRFDTMHQIMGVDAPLRVSAAGGRFSLKDCGDIPDVLQVTYEYPGFILSYEAVRTSGHGAGGRTPGMKYYNAKGEFDRPHGHAYYGTNGALFCDRIGYEIYPENDRVIRKTHNTTDATALHARHFIDCVRSRRQSPADVEVGHRSTIVAHLGNIAFRVGKKLEWNRDAEDFTGAPEASALLRRQARAPWNWL